MNVAILARLSLASVLVTCALPACGTSATIPRQTAPLSRLPNSVASNPSADVQMYVFSPQRRSIARYPAATSGLAEPGLTLTGSSTEFAEGHGGAAIEKDGTLYVIVRKPSARLVVFAPNAHGNQAPIRVARLSGINPGGIALDGHGRFWTADLKTGSLVRYAETVSGLVRPEYSIAPQLDTPIGYVPAYATTVAIDGSGDVYCFCTALVRGAQARGVSQYQLSDTHATLVRSFYDSSTPEFPPTMLHIDKTTGMIVLASSLYRTGVYVYPKDTPSGSVTSTQVIAGPNTTVDNVASVTTGPDSEIYVATKTGISIFPPTASGNVAPSRRILDRDNLSLGLDAFGDFITFK